MRVALLASGALGMRDEAFAVLEKIYADTFADLSGIYVSPNYDNLRSDSPFHVLLRPMNLPQ